jgi:hypothetical protein
MRNDGRRIRDVASCTVVALAIVFAFSCNKRQGETSPTVSSAPRNADNEQTASSSSTASSIANESSVNTPEDPELQERLAHETWHGDLDGIAKRRFLRVLVSPNKLGFYFDWGEIHGAIYEFSREFSTT